MLVHTDKAALRNFLDMVNFLASHVPNLAMITAPLCALLKTNTHFLWAHEPNNTLEKLKAILSVSPILQYFDLSVCHVIQADASQHHGLGACLLQKGQPMLQGMYISNTECKFDHIEKELLAIGFACSKLTIWFSH